MTGGMSSEIINIWYSTHLMVCVWQILPDHKLHKTQFNGSILDCGFLRALSIKWVWHCRTTKTFSRCLENLWQVGTYFNKSKKIYDGVRCCALRKMNLLDVIIDNFFAVTTTFFCSRCHVSDTRYKSGAHFVNSLWSARYYTYLYGHQSEVSKTGFSYKSVLLGIVWCWKQLYFYETHR